MSVLSTTDTGLHRKLTEDILVQRGYVLSDRTHAVYHYYQKNMGNCFIEVMYNTAFECFWFKFYVPAEIIQENQSNQPVTCSGIYDFEFHELKDLFLIEQYYSTFGEEQLKIRNELASRSKMEGLIDWQYINGKYFMRRR